jgi:tetratricopeptide (TPR) repeat protein
MAHFRLGYFEEATDALQTSVEFLRRMDDKRGVALVLHALGDVALAQDHLPEASDAYRQALQYCLDTGEKRRAAFCLEGFAAVTHRAGKPARAAMLLGTAEALRQEIGAPLYDAERAAYDALVAQVRANLGAAAFDESFRVGQTLRMEEGITAALEE